MRNRIYVSTSAFRTKKLCAILDICAECGIRDLELGSNAQCGTRDLERLKTLSSGSMNFLVHNYFPPLHGDLVINLGSDNADIISRSMDQCRASIDLAAEIKSPYYSVHCGYAFDAGLADLGSRIMARRTIPLDQAIEVFLKNIIELNGYAGKRGVGFLIENHEVSKRNLIGGKNIFFIGAAPEDLKLICEKVDSRNFGILVDLGHLKVAAASMGFSATDFMKELSSYVKAFHMSDNNGKNDLHLNFDDNAWFGPIVASSDAALTIESHDLEAGQIKDCIEAINRW